MKKFFVLIGLFLILPFACQNNSQNIRFFTADSTLQLLEAREMLYPFGLSYKNVKSGEVVNSTSVPTFFGYTTFENENFIAMVANDSIWNHWQVSEVFTCSFDPGNGVNIPCLVYCEIGQVAYSCKTAQGLELFGVSDGVFKIPSTISLFDNELILKDKDGEEIARVTYIYGTFGKISDAGECSYSPIPGGSVIENNHGRGLGYYQNCYTRFYEKHIPQEVDPFLCPNCDGHVGKITVQLPENRQVRAHFVGYVLPGDSQLKGCIDGDVLVPGDVFAVISKNKGDETSHVLVFRNGKPNQQYQVADFVRFEDGEWWMYAGEKKYPVF